MFAVLQINLYHWKHHWKADKADLAEFIMNCQSGNYRCIWQHLVQLCMAPPSRKHTQGNIGERARHHQKLIQNKSSKQPKSHSKYLGFF